MRGLIIIFLLSFSISHAQIARPITILQATLMPTKVGVGNVFGYNDDYYLQDGNGYVEQPNVSFPSTAKYRFDISAYSNQSGGAYSNLEVRIDGIAVASFSVNSTTIKMFSVVSTDNITAGTHSVALALTNDKFNGKADMKLRLALCYITQSSVAGKIVLPVINRSDFPTIGKYLNTNNFMSGHLRGFNLGEDQTNAGVYKTVKQDLIDAKNLGANLFRYHLTINKGAGDDYSIEDGDLAHADSLAAWCAEFGCWLNVDFYVYPHASDETYWGNSAQKASLASLWKTVADHFKNNTTVAVYSLMNEPGKDERNAEWLLFEMQMIDSIRTADTNHCILAPFCHDQNILDMQEPLPYTNIIYEEHMYDPFAITTQGLGAVTNAPCPYPSTASDPAGVYTKADLSAKFQVDRNFVANYNAPFYVSEFSCAGWATTNWANASMYSRDQWIKDCIEIMDAEGWAWTFEGWRGYEAWDAEISPRFWDSICPERVDGMPTCNVGAMDSYESDTTTAIQILIRAFALNPVKVEPQHDNDFAKNKDNNTERNSDKDIYEKYSNLNTLIVLPRK